MCDCGKPSTTEALTDHVHAAASAVDKVDAHAGHTHAAPAPDADAACACAPSGQGHHPTHTGVATSA